MAPFRALIKGDSHMGMISAGVRRDDEVDELYRGAVQEALRVRPDVFVDLGDLSDKGYPSPRQYAMLMSCFAVLTTEGIPVLLLRGNHDGANRPDAEHALEPFAAVPWPGKGLHVAAMVEAWRPPGRPDVEVLCLPYVPPRQVPEDYETQQAYYDRLAASWLTTSAGRTVKRSAAEGPALLSEAGLTLRSSHTALQKPEHRLVVAHLNLAGATRGDLLVRDVDVQVPTALIGKVPVFCGHLHKYQVVRAEHPPAVVVGSMAHTDFGEARDRKGYVLWESP